MRSSSSSTTAAYLDSICFALNRRPGISVVGSTREGGRLGALAHHAQPDMQVPVATLLAAIEADTVIHTVSTARCAFECLRMFVVPRLT